MEKRGAGSECLEIVGRFLDPGGMHNCAQLCVTKENLS